MSEEPRYPDLAGKNIQRQVNDLRDYTVNLQRYVRWALSNIEPRNYSAAARKNLVDMSMTVTDTEGIVTEWRNELESTPDGLSGLIEKVTTDGAKLEALTNSYNATALGIESLITRVEANEGNITSYYNEYKSTADGISRRVGKVEGDYENLSEDYEGFKKNYSNFIQEYNQIGMTVVGSDGKETKVLLSGGKLDLSGFATFASLEGIGTTTINGSNIKTGTISAERLDLSSRESKSGYTFETLLTKGMLLSVRHTGNLFASGNAACALDPVEGLSLGTYGEAYGEVYTDGTALKIYGKGGIHLNGKAFPGGFSLSEFNNNLSLSNFNNNLSLSNFTNNAIAMATAYTTTANIAGGKDIDMSSITEKDSADVFSRAYYSDSYGYGIKCSKEGYYLVSAHANLVETAVGTTTLAIRKVVGGTSTFIAKALQYHGYGSTQGYCVNIAPMLVYLEANSYLSLYNSDSGSKTNGSNGCHLTAVYLGI